MLILALTTDKLGLITDSTATVDVHVSYVNDLSDAMTAGKQNTAISSAVASPGTDIKAAPASGVDNIKFISIRNKDGATTANVTAIYNANGTIYQLMKATLLAGEELVCREGVWFHYDTNGGVYGQALPVASDTAVGGVQIAVQSDMEAGTSTTVAVTPGRQKYHPGHPKAWLSCGVAADIQQSFGITSLTDTGTGVVTITITSAFSASNFCIIAQVEATGTTWAVANSRECHIRSATRATTSVALDCIDNTVTTNLVKDPTTWHCVMFGDLP